LGRARAATGLARPRRGGQTGRPVARPYLLLMRAPLAAGAVSNLLTGYVLARPAGPLDGAEVLPLLALAAATCGFYWAGMVLNDYFDLERDRTLAPGRPLPAGVVAPGAALALGLGFLGAGLALATAAGALAGRPLGGLVGGLLVAAPVLGYDAWLKRDRLPGAAGMGACRIANALLPAAALLGWPDDPVALVAYAAFIGGHVFWLTVLSTYEDEEITPPALLACGAGLLAGPAAVALLAVGGLGGPGGPHPAALVGAAGLAAVVGAQLWQTMEQGSLARGGRTTISLLKAIWLVDLSALLAAAAWPVLPVWAALWAAATAGAKALFAPPPPRPE